LASQRKFEHFQSPAFVDKLKNNVRVHACKSSSDTIPLYIALEYSTLPIQYSLMCI
jgi:hypothetical protein